MQQNPVCAKKLIGIKCSAVTNLYTDVTVRGNWTENELVLSVCCRFRSGLYLTPGDQQFHYCGRHHHCCQPAQGLSVLSHQVNYIAVGGQGKE